MQPQQSQQSATNLTQEDWEPIVEAFGESGQKRSEMLKEAVKTLVSEGKSHALSTAFREIETYIQEGSKS